MTLNRGDFMQRIIEKVEVKIPVQKKMIRVAAYSNE